MNDPTHKPVRPPIFNARPELYSTPTIPNMPNTLTTDQEVPLTVQPLTALGNPATLTGIPLWSSSNVNVISLTVASNGLSASAIATGAGTSTITVAGNAGTVAVPVQVTGTLVLTVTQAPAASIVITAGTPVPN